MPTADPGAAYKDPRAEWNVEWKTVAWEYYWRVHGHYKAVEEYLWMHVLDVGCGPGFLAARCYPNIGWYTGVDISPQAIEIAKSLFPGAHFQVVDVEHEKLPFGDGQFETVVCSETLEHITDHTLILSELKRVSNTYIVITVPWSMGGCGHVYPRWEWADIQAKFSPLGKILEIRWQSEQNFWLVYIRKQ